MASRTHRGQSQSRSRSRSHTSGVFANNNKMPAWPFSLFLFASVFFAVGWVPAPALAAKPPEVVIDASSPSGTVLRATFTEGDDALAISGENLTAGVLGGAPLVRAVVTITNPYDAPIERLGLRRGGRGEGGTGGAASNVHVFTPPIPRHIEKHASTRRPFQSASRPTGAECIQHVRTTLHHLRVYHVPEVERRNETK